MFFLFIMKEHFRTLLWWNIVVFLLTKLEFFHCWMVKKQIERALLVTGFGYDHDKAWETNLDLFKHYTDVSRVREFLVPIA